MEMGIGVVQERGVAAGARASGNHRYASTRSTARSRGSRASASHIGSLGRTVAGDLERNHGRPRARCPGRPVLAVGPGIRPPGRRSGGCLPAHPTRESRRRRRSLRPGPAWRSDSVVRRRQTGTLQHHRQPRCAGGDRECDPGDVRAPRDQERGRALPLRNVGAHHPRYFQDHVGAISPGRRLESDTHLTA
jgi:hypothetical protein